MTRKPKSWAEKMVTPPPHVEKVEKPFGGIPAGAMLLVSSPAEIDAWLRRHTRAGDVLDVPALRQALAKRHRADATCPLTTGIFLRIVAENAWDALERGATPDAVAPFWRVVAPSSPLAKKLRAGGDWIAAQRAAESDR